MQCVCVCTCVYVCLLIYIYIYIYYIYLYICIYIYLYICIYIFVYLYIYVHVGVCILCAGMFCGYVSIHVCVCLESIHDISYCYAILSQLIIVAIQFSVKPQLSLIKNMCLCEIWFVLYSSLQILYSNNYLYN